MFHLFSSKHTNIANVLDQTISKLNARDPAVMAELEKQAKTTDPATIEGYREQIINQMIASKAGMATDPKTKEPDFASRDAFLGLVQTNMGRAAHATEAPALANLANDWQQFGDADPRWALCPIVSFFTWKQPKAPFVNSSDPEAYVHVEHRQKFTIAIMADWGAANQSARDIATLIQQKSPDYVIHLGDVYYAGTKAECEAVLDMWPLRDGEGKPKKDFSFALNGNHEMFCGGRNYFGTILPAFNQLASYFSLRTPHWQFLGLDTAYAGGTLSAEEVKPQWDWLVQNLRNHKDLSTVFLTHHQPVSAHAQEYSDAAPLRKDVASLQEQTSDDAIHGWFFGHEHRAVIYDDAVTGYKARLIGNGAIPHDAQNETAPEENCTGFTNVNKGIWGSGNAISSFVLLTVEGPVITVEYIDQNGKPSCLPTETWTARSAASV